MVADSNPKTTLLLRAIAAVREKTGVEEALVALVDVLRRPLDLWQASLASVSTDGVRFSVLAFWSALESVFEVGVEVKGVPREDAERFDQFIKGNEPLFVRTGDYDETLASHLMRVEGVSALVMMPLRSEQTLLMLTLGSGSPTALADMGTAFFRSLGAGVGEQLISLAAASAGPA